MRASASVSPAHPLIREYHRSLAELRSQGVEHELGPSPAVREPAGRFRAPARLAVRGRVRRQGRRPPHPARWHGLRRQQLPPRLLGIQGLPRRPRPRNRPQDPPRLSRHQHHLRGHPPRRALPEPRQGHGGRPLRRAPACRPPLPLLRPHRARHPRVRAGGGGVRQARAGPGARPGRRRSPKPTATTAGSRTPSAASSRSASVSLNPNISREAVDEMLVQHLLTERLFRTIFDNPEFTRRNAIAAEVEKVIEALASQSFSRTEFLKSLDPFYRAIENAARTTADFTEKQHFLNTVYERFFQGYRVKVADTHGIVYTPQPIVDFMCASVAEVLKRSSACRSRSPGVNILDPCTGTGNFIVQPDAADTEARPAAHVQGAVVRQRSDADAVLHRGAEHRARLLRADGPVRAVRGPVLRGHAGDGRGPPVAHVQPKRTPSAWSARARRRSR